MTTDAQQALAQVREALATGPTPGEWRYIVDDGDRKLTAEVSGSFMCDTAYYPWCPDNEGDWKLIAACSPPNIAAILAHVEAQEAENERLTAALQHEADCVEAYRAQAETMIRERNELRRQLAEAELDAGRYRWLRNEANTARKCDPMVCIYPLDEQDLIDGDRLDVAINAAMGLTRPAEEA